MLRSESVLVPRGLCRSFLVFGICQLLMVSKLSQMSTATFRSLEESRAHDFAGKKGLPCEVVDSLSLEGCKPRMTTCLGC